MKIWGSIDSNLCRGCILFYFLGTWWVFWWVDPPPLGFAASRRPGTQCSTTTRRPPAASPRSSPPSRSRISRVSSPFKYFPAIKLYCLLRDALASSCRGCTGGILHGEHNSCFWLHQMIKLVDAHGVWNPFSIRIIEPPSCRLLDAWT